jgi:hypothetical protein
MELDVIRPIRIGRAVGAAAAASDSYTIICHRKFRLGNYFLNAAKHRGRRLDVTNLCFVWDARELAKTVDLGP